MEAAGAPGLQAGLTSGPAGRGVSGRADLIGPLRTLRTWLGSPMDAHTAWLLLRSLETTAPPKNREEEAAKAKARAAERFGD